MTEKLKLIQTIGLILTALSFLIATTLYISDKPSRSEVKEMINEKVYNRFDRIESQLDQVQADIKTLLIKRAEKWNFGKTGKPQYADR